MDHEKWKTIDTFIFDVDGVFTDGKLLITDDGKFLRTMSVKDGMALMVAVLAGFTVAFLYMGDDLADLVLFDKVLLSCAPYNAAHEVIKAAEYISPQNGGDGAVRDVIEKVLRTHNKWGQDY